MIIGQWAKDMSNQFRGKIQMANKQMKKIFNFLKNQENVN